MNQHEKMNYVELPSQDLAATKAFFTAVFNWQFSDFGPDYTAFANQGLNGGFYRADLASDSSKGAALIVFYSEDLAATLNKIEHAGGKISKAVFEFPGGRRFHFKEPCGNEFAVWSDKP
ncbi:MAG: VOC family protein [Pseudomonadota bacterium]|nr:VOC family protein [Pseudomonadota bacterium]